MFMEERHAAILDILAEKGSITTSEIQAKFGISYDSAKRDLRLLEESGKLRRTHGGAIPLGALSSHTARRSMNSGADTTASARIAEHAAALVNEGELIYLPTGDIGELIAQRLSRTARIRVVTGSIAIAQMLYRREGTDVILLGGEVDEKGSVHGSFSADMIRRFRFDKAFLATDAVSADFGVSVNGTAELAHLTAAADSARKVIGVYPSQSIGQSASISVCPAKMLGAILTDGDIAEIERRALEKCGVSLVICE